MHFYALFFFKQKTAYEMRISDWSSDVCSSDLAEAARARANRYKPLAEQQAVSQQDYTDALAQARGAEAAVKQQQAALESAQVNLKFTTVPAPITGRIGRSLFTVGALVTSSQTEPLARSEEHTSELQSLMRISYAVFCL